MTDLVSVRRQIHEWRVGARYSAARRLAKAALPPLPPRLAPLLAQLERDGAAVTTLDFLGAETGLVPELETLLAATGSPENREKGYVQHAPDDAVAAARHVIRWGLGEEILALCANYIGLPVAYRGVVVRRDLANGEESGTRVWHRDAEDDRILKLIVYVRDVRPDGGPFEYVPKSRTPPTWRVSLRDGNRADEFARLVPPEHWRACTGPRGTVVIVDTCAVYHRGRVPVAADRLTAFYCFNSNRPMRPEYCEPLFDRDRFIAGNRLTPLQTSALTYRY